MWVNEVGFPHSPNLRKSLMGDTFRTRSAINGPATIRWLSSTLGSNDFSIINIRTSNPDFPSEDVLTSVNSTNIQTTARFDHIPEKSWHSTTSVPSTVRFISYKHTAISKRSSSRNKIVARAGNAAVTSPGGKGPNHQVINAARILTETYISQT